MISVLICFSLGLVTLYFQYQRFKEAKTNIKDALSKNEYNNTFYGKGLLVLIVSLIVFAISSIIFSINTNGYPTIALGVVLVFLGLGELLNFQNSHTIYYNDDAIIVNGKHIRYRSIKSLKTKGFRKQSLDITTLKGDVEVTNIKAYEYISQHTKIKL